MKIYTKVTGTGAYLPETVLTNQALAERYGLDTSDEWIVPRTGIKQRHKAAPDETTASLAVQAAKKAIDMAAVDLSAIDMVIVATSTPDACMPSTACKVQQALSLKQIPAFDINAACSGFVYALSMADHYIRGGTSKCVLVIGSDVFTRILDWSDRTTCVLFGDGAGAFVVQAAEEPGIIATHLHANGQQADLLKTTPCSWFANSHPPNPVHIHMQGRALFKQAVAILGDIVDETLKKHGFEQSDVDWLVPHQANRRIIQATAERLGMSMEQVIVTVDKHANTSAASIPLAFDTAVRDGRLQKGQRVLLEAFGAGLTWGSALLTY